MNDLFNSFIAFNQNGFSYLLYMFSQNWSLVIILISAVISTIIYFREEIDLTTREEQNIL